MNNLTWRTSAHYEWYLTYCEDVYRLSYGLTTDTSTSIQMNKKEADVLFSILVLYLRNKIIGQKFKMSTYRHNQIQINFTYDEIILSNYNNTIYLVADHIDGLYANLQIALADKG